MDVILKQSKDLNNGKVKHHCPKNTRQIPFNMKNLVSFFFTFRALCTRGLLQTEKVSQYLYACSAMHTGLLAVKYSNNNHIFQHKNGKNCVHEVCFCFGCRALFEKQLCGTYLYYSKDRKMTTLNCFYPHTVQITCACCIIWIRYHSNILVHTI